ncbi:MAG: response regulator [Elusimicrobiota bacterium]
MTAVDNKMTEKKYKIIVVEDNIAVINNLKFVLEKHDYDFIPCKYGTDAIREIREKKPELIIMDLGLPDIDGIDICRILKQDSSTKNIPIIMLTGKTSDREKILGLKTGADDYVTKPFSCGELLARIEAVLRRTYSDEKELDSSKMIKKGDIQLDVSKREVKVNKQDISLTNKQFDLLYVLMEKEEKVLSRDFLMEYLWKYDENVHSKALDIHICRLRKKLGKKAGRYIKTVRAIGYKFSTSENE